MRDEPINLHSRNENGVTNPHRLQLRVSEKSPHVWEESGTRCSFAVKIPAVQVGGKKSGSKTETYSRITTSCGPDGRLNFEPRSWFSFRVAGTSRLAISIFLVHEPLVQ